MTKNPIVNALAALIYIIVIASIMFYGMKNTGPDNSVIVPIFVLSMLTLSAVFMSYVFFFQPVQLYLDGKKKESVSLFSKTLVAFAIITTILLIVFLSGLYKLILPY